MNKKLKEALGNFCKTPALIPKAFKLFHAWGLVAPPDAKPQGMVCNPRTQNHRVWFGGYGSGV